MDKQQYEDKRLDKIDTTIEGMSKDLELVKQKIYNGFSHSIESTENKVNYIDTQNTIAHKELKSDIKDLSKKFDKILWMFGAGALLFVIKEIIQGAL